MKISVVTISYNQGKYLEAAIKSVVDQGYKEVEYIIVDPGSTDGSRDIIKSYKDNFSEILFEPDNGPADGLNKGLVRCTGDIFCYLNADDRFTYDAFEFVSNFFSENPHFDGLIGSAYIIDQNGKKRRRKAQSSQYDLSTISRQTALALQQATFLKLSELKKHSIKFNTENTTCWDAELLVDFCLSGARLYTVNKTLGEFRIYPDSITGSNRLQRKYHEDMQKIFQKMEKAGYLVKKDNKASKFLTSINPLRIINSYLK